MDGLVNHKDRIIYSTGYAYYVASNDAEYINRVCVSVYRNPDHDSGRHKNLPLNAHVFRVDFHFFPILWLHHVSTGFRHSKVTYLPIHSAKSQPISVKLRNGARLISVA